MLSHVSAVWPHINLWVLTSTWSLKKFMKNQNLVLWILLNSKCLLLHFHPRTQGTVTLTILKISKQGYIHSYHYFLFVWIEFYKVSNSFPLHCIPEHGGPICTTLKIRRKITCSFLVSLLHCYNSDRLLSIIVYFAGHN